MSGEQGRIASSSARGPVEYTEPEIKEAPLEGLFDFLCDPGGFAFSIRTVRPQGEPVALESRDEVYVRVVHGLTRMFAVIHHHVHTVSAERFVERDRHDARCLGRMVPVFRQYVEDVRGVRLRDDERMSWGDRADVEEGERVLVLEYLRRGDGTRYYPAEDASRIVHAMSILAA